MDGLEAAILTGFVATWLQIALLYYKIGKLEEKLKVYAQLFRRGDQREKAK